jgi:hypothetical protein
MILSGHQPTYLPGIILFTKIALSDAFMFVPHCQYESGSWQNRNQIRNARLTVPVMHGFGQSIADAKIDGDHWRRRHLNSMKFGYGKRPYFKNYFATIEEIINASKSLVELNCNLIAAILGWLEIKTPVLFSTDYEIRGHKTNMLIDMCAKTGATEYLSNEGARDYVDEEKMAAAGIKHRWLNFTHPIYDQGHSEFITNLSIIDLLFNCGPGSGRIVREAGSVS